MNQLHKKLLFIIIGLAVIAGGIWIVIAGGGYTNAPTPQVTEDSLTRGLVGYWSFEEGSGQTTADLSGNGNTGTLGADANPGADDPNWTTASGRPSSAVAAGAGGLDFDGSDDVINVSHNTILSPTYLTISLWAKNTSPTTDYRGMIGKNPEYRFYYRYVFVDGWKSEVSFANTNLTPNTTTYTFGSVIDTSFYHYVVSYDGSSVKIYVNGVEKASQAVTGSLGSGVGIVTIGRDYGYNMFYGGQIDDVRIYNRALSPEEIRYLYNRGGPVSRWGLDEGSGSTAYDSSSNNNDLTLTNMEAGDWQTGKSGSALSFDGTNEYLTRAYDTDFNFSTNNFTIGGWFKHETISTNPDYLITRFTGAGWKTFIDSDGDICFGIDDDATWTPDDSACSTNQNYDDNNWHYFSAVRNTSSIELYIDGVKQAEDTSLSATATLSGTSPILYVGIDSDGASNAWEGMLDEIVIYYYARDSASIKTDYNLGLAAHFGPNPSAGSGQATCQEDPGSCLTKGLVGYWDFEEGSGQTVADLSGNGNTGTLGANSSPGADDPRWTTAASLPRTAIAGGGALSFDGSNDYVDCGTNSILNITGSLTLTAWTYATDGTYATIIERDNIANGYRFGIGNSSAGKADISLGNAGGGGWVGGTSNVLNAWHFLVGVWDGSAAKIYVDGKLEKTTVMTAALGVSENLVLGAQDGTSNRYAGLIDEVRIYNRALSAEEIRYLYNRGGPVLHYKFDEGSGTTAHDEVGDVDAAFPGASANQPSWSSP